MPAIEALAHDSVVFDRAYSHSPQVLPSYASLLSGELPPEHGVRDDAGFVLRQDARTLAEQLRNRGFVTGGAVSSFLLRKETGTAQGFSFFDGEMPRHEPTAPPAPERDGLATSAIAEDWMRMQSGQRYFLFLEVDDSSADAVVSRVVQLLKDRDLYDGSTILLTAAHGDTSARAWLDDRSLAIPLIVKQPDAEGAGRNVATPVQQIDIMPTVLDLVRAPIPGGLRGRSLRPVLDGDDVTLTPQAIYAESLAAAWRFGGVPLYSLTQDGYRLTRAATDSIFRIDQDAPIDPAEQSRLERLATALDRLLANREITPPEPIAAADQAPLGATGYLQGLRILQPPAMPLEQEQQALVAEKHAAAARLVGRRDLAAAIAALRGMAAQHPDLAPIQFQIGSLLAQTGRMAEAIAALTAAATLREDDADIATALARVHLRARQTMEAKARAAEAVALAERSGVPALIADAHEIAMRVSLAEPDADAAAMHAQLGEKADPARPLMAYARGRIAFGEGKHAEALTAFQEAIKVTRESGRELADLHQATGEALTQLERFDDAEMELREELRAFPDSVRPYGSLVSLYQAQQRDDAAHQAIEELVQRAPTPEGYAAASRLWTLVGERAKADALRAEARRRFPPS
jgi:tetratricopeptide (TPR) repeat protein